MKRAILVEGGVVVNVSLFKDVLFEGWIENNDAQIGWIKNGDGILEPPPEPELTPEEQTKLLVKQATDVTLAYIQAVVDAYNDAHGVVFTDVHSCANFMNNPTYTHYQFCCDAWNWSVDVWEAARSIQDQVFGGQITQPSQEEFIAMLPVYNGAV